MVTDSEDGWETTSEVASESETKYDTAVKRKREKALKDLKEAKKETEEPIKPDAPRKMTPDCEQLDARIRDDPDLKFGFRIYRTTYKSQEKWDRFMFQFKERVRLNFQEYGAAHLYDRMDWCVQDDPALARASPTKVRRYGLNSDSVIRSAR